MIMQFFGRNHEATEADTGTGCAQVLQLCQQLYGSCVGMPMVMPNVKQF